MPPLELEERMSVYEVWKVGELIKQGNVAEALSVMARSQDKEDEREHQ